jgi:hypothetical protein
MNIKSFYHSEGKLALGFYKKLYCKRLFRNSGKNVIPPAEIFRLSPFLVFQFLPPILLCMLLPISIWFAGA